jgi:CopG family transcriptional regulator / antitoxin EndoAI
MSVTQTQDRKRINITLPERTIRLLDRIAEKGERSKLIDQAVHFYAERQSRDRLRQLLREGAQRRAQRDLALAEDWFDLEEEAWPHKRG